MNPIDALISLALALLLCVALVKMWRLIGSCVVLLFAVLLTLSTAGVLSAIYGAQLSFAGSTAGHLVFGDQLDAWVEDSFYVAFFGPAWARFTDGIRERAAVNA